MRMALALLYVATGLLCIFVDVGTVGALLGMATPTYRLESVAAAALLTVGPALLILAGAAILIEGVSRGVLCAATGMVVLFGLALWTVPRIGWRTSISLVLGPEIGAFLLAGLLVLILRRRWVMAAVGSAVSSAFFLHGTGAFVYSLLFGNAIPSWTEMWIVFPALLTIASFISALSVRIA
jgi:hypothetical protein